MANPVWISVDRFKGSQVFTVLLTDCSPDLVYIYIPYIILFCVVLPVTYLSIMVHPVYM